MLARKSRLFNDKTKDNAPLMLGEQVELNHLNKPGGTVFMHMESDPFKSNPSAKAFAQALTDKNFDEAEEIFTEADDKNKQIMLKALLLYDVYNGIKLDKHPLRAKINLYVENYFQADEKNFKSSANQVFGLRLHELSIVQWYAALNEPDLIDKLFTRFPKFAIDMANYMSTTKHYLMIAPLHIAASYGFEEATACLLKHGADPFIRTSAGFKPIAVAAFRGHLNVVKLFHTDPVFLQSRANDGLSLMHHAAFSGNVEIVKHLHAHAVSMTTTTPTLATPIMISLAKGHDDLTQYFYAQGARGNDKDSQDKTHLHYACDSKKLSTLQLAFEKNRDHLNATNKRGVTPFYYAIALNFTEGALFLLEQGCDYRKTSIYGCEPLHLAASFNNLVMIEELLKRDVDYSATAIIKREDLDLFVKDKLAIKHRFLQAMQGREQAEFTAEQIADIYNAPDAAKLLASKRRVDEELNSFTLM